MPTLLVVDDEPNVLYSLEKGLRSDKLEVICAATGKQAIEIVQRQPPDAVILDVRLPDMSGLDAFDQIRQLDARLPVILITAYAATETAIEAMKRGAFEYLLKPVDFHKLRDVVGRATELSRARRVPIAFDGAQPVAGEVDCMVGRSGVMQEVYKAIGRVAPQDVNVLILGENGTGKELVARAIYNHSRRRTGPFLAINCAAIPEALLESELFGHERGAFTGAERRRIGKFEQAHQGTLFLDEIGDMPLASQAKMLRLLQEQQFERLGGNEVVQTDVRIVAATNKDLDALVAAGKFRQDLFYRLKVYTIRVPPLRERLDDLPLLVEHFVKLFNGKLGKQIADVSAETLDLLARQRWPGNVRELQSTIKYAFVQARGELLTPDCLPEQGGAEPSATSETPDLRRFVRELLAAGDPELYRRVTLLVDRLVIDEALRHARGSQVRASELLGISRTTLRAKLRALGMMGEKFSLSESVQSVQNLHSD
ncbi:MAG: sigma-54-dependent Fis family transcriptional regulator [Planctomycetia bacterium]|nr:sigma-54-dependent Fis family transcriptional regulator [Planctomycetia bacterium]